MPKVSEAYLETRRREILDAAIACFTRKGFHQTTMDEICRQAELSAGAVYRYFASKDEIIEAAVQQGFDPDFVGWIEGESTRFDDFRDLMDLMTRIYFRRFEQQPGIETTMKLRLRAWVEALHNPEVKKDVLARWNHHLALTEEMIRRAQELGQIDPDLDPAAAARVMQAVDDGFTLQWVIDPEFDIWKYREAELALYGGTFWRRREEEPEQARTEGRRSGRESGS